MHIRTYTIDINGTILAPSGLIYLGEGDTLSDSFSFTLKEGSSPVDYTGATLSAHLVRADGACVYLTGSVTDGKAVFNLTSACYAVPGGFTLAFKLVKSGATVTFAILKGVILPTQSEAIVNDGGTYTLAQLMALINAKADAPASEGASGNVYGLDGNLSPVWMSVAGSQVAGAVKVDGTALTLRTGSAGAAGYLTLVLESEE